MKKNDMDKEFDVSLAENEAMMPAEDKEYPVLALRDMVVFPDNVASLFIGRSVSLKAAQAAYEYGTPLVLLTQKNAMTEIPQENDLYHIGVLAKVKRYVVMPDGTLAVYPGNNTGVEKNGVEYYPYGGPGDQNSMFYKLDKDINDSNRSFYCFQIRKGLDESGNNPNPQTPWYNMRYSEILLTYAEAVVESGKGDKGLAKKCLNEVRHRAGFKDDIELTLENVLHEWKCGIAFENQWSHVPHRRRAFITSSGSSMEEGPLVRKLTLIPIVDLSGAEAQYIFVRCYPYNATQKQGYNGSFDYKANDYYSQIPNYAKNHLVPNNLNVAN
jgi:hypothetical protein